ncbi:MAG: RagB/SusD family nutrient uptake outer membrane protein [Bacteroidota bacterium]
MSINKKFINKLVIIGLLIFMGTGCENFLDEQNKSAITQENYFKNATDARVAVNGIYPMLYTLQTDAGNNYGEEVWVSIEMIVGHATTLGQSLYNNGLIQHGNSPIEPIFKVMWNGFYKGIASANLCINNIPFIEMDEATKNALLGEAYFLRALYYYYLVRLYGDIPLVIETIDYSSPDLYAKRSPKEDIYDLIVNDLLEAEKSGLPSVNNTGKVSLGAVKSLLASVYLTMAGHPLDKGAEYYTLAADKAKEVIDNKWYNLFESYDYLHDRAHKNGSEFIFQVQYKYGVQNNQITEFVTPDKIGISKLSGEIGALVSCDEFVDSYEPNDKRAKERQFFFTKYPAKNNPANTINFNEYALYKFWLVEAAGTNGDANSDENFTMLRLPEVMLIYAEASNEMNGPIQDAYDQINLIRNRTELPPLSGLMKDEFREAIWRERYHELCFENKAYFDIQRTHKAYNLETGNFEDAFIYINKSGVKFNEQYMLWPIPQSEIDANPKLKPQNPGW